MSEETKTVEINYFNIFISVIHETCNTVLNFIQCIIQPSIISFRYSIQRLFYCK